MPAATKTLVLVATRKGAWLFRSDARRRTWAVDGPHFLGHQVSQVVLDPRDGRPASAEIDDESKRARRLFIG